MKAQNTPLQRYQQDLDEGILVSDSAQALAVQELQKVFDAILHSRRKRQRSGSLFNLFKTRNTSAAAVKGLYLWGGVGRGKTCLMDMFYQCLPPKRKMRMHFHRFMLMVHKRLNAEKQQKNPLQRVAASIADEVDVLCFDEFFVTDIGDAMILSGLLETLFAAGVTLVATSNVEPRHLYENGLQRANFLPAIALLEQNTKVINVDAGVDYRLRSLEQAEIYHSPLGAEAEHIMLESFGRLSAGLNTVVGGSIEIQGREIICHHRVEDLVWFEFDNICGGPRGTSDYIEIAQLFHTVMISNVPQLGATNDDKARRFVSLVDEFYDHKVKLILSVACPLREIYQGSELKFVFERTRSRLLEMQSHEYLALEHSP